MIWRLVALLLRRGGSRPLLTAVVFLAAVAAVALVVGAGALASTCSPACVERVKARVFAEHHGGCRDVACVQRVERRRLVAELARYHASPMPSCTWDVESGPGLPPWAAIRYVARNARSTAAGKFQFLDTTWHAIGGRDYPGDHDAARAPPVVQERLARVLRALNGLRPWILCP